MVNITLIIGIFAGIILRYKLSFNASTEKGTPFDYKKWWKENKYSFTWTVVGTVFLTSALRLNKVFEYYESVIIPQYPILDVFVPEVVIGVIIGYSGNKYIKNKLKKYSKE